MSTSIELKDNFKVRGILEILKIKAATGEVVERIEDDNLVVNGGRSGMAHLWAGEWYAGPPTGWVDEMKFGDGGHELSDPTLPKTTSVDREQLFCEDEARSPIISKKPLTVDYPDGDSGTRVRFSCTVGAAEGNEGGTSPGRRGYSEAGLYRDDGILACHKTFGLITKTNEFILTMRWSFVF
jgi:hypothetical protein